ncbi:SGNH/GDSL hydrolase family protein [Pseudarthrobacter sp. lyk4-40-TYG-27]|uniref:SGNH/GDSL hydrolase family protein n=1 Tax=Pseudarthrobacter sp. lyk4-40-TYG-27 TaxID=3040305 RepID=UPI002552F634|nr:SGNH/GDSL hydrolase family protein [Pseudarthrobacter sp. lyk4-40-TYG-27]
MKLGGFLALSAALVLTGCSSTPPPVSEQVQKAYDAGKTLPPSTPAPTLPPLVPLSIKAGDKAIFLGDSWTFGQHIPDFKQGFAYLTIDKMDLDGQVLGFPGSGFLNPNKRTEGDYRQRIAALPADPALKLMVIQGGTNDRDQSHFDLTQAVVDTVKAAKDKFPAVQVVLMGPMSPGYPKDPRITIVDRAISNGAEISGVQFVDPDAEQWISDINKDANMDPATGHPTVAGHVLIANKLKDALMARTKPTT